MEISYLSILGLDNSVPWVNDGLRDLGDQKKREEMFEIFKSELARRNIPYILVQGDWAEREQIIVKALKNLAK